MLTQRPAPHGVPPFRRLRGYAFDPSLSTQLETAVMNQVVFRVRWEPLAPPPTDPLTFPAPAPDPFPQGRGPVGEYVEVVDVDPPSRCLY